MCGECEKMFRRSKSNPYLEELGEAVMDFEEQLEAAAKTKDIPIESLGVKKKDEQGREVIEIEVKGFVMGFSGGDGKSVLSKKKHDVSKEFYDKNQVK